MVILTALALTLGTLPAFAVTRADAAWTHQPHQPHLAPQAVEGGSTQGLAHAAPLPPAARIAPALGPVREALILNSYQDDYVWATDLMRGLDVSVISQAPGVFFHREFMNSKYVYDDAVEAGLAAMLAAKYRGRDLALVIACDENAFHFMLRRGEELFPGVPVVFCGVNDFRQEMLTGRPNLTGVVEDFDMERILRIAMALHPSIRRVNVISDDTSTMVLVKRHLRRVAESFAGKLEFDFWADDPLAVILEKASKLGEHDLIYYLNYHRDREGRVYNSEDALERIAKASQTPIYSNWTFLLGHGIVGGLLCDGFEQGRVAGELALAILNGTPPERLPVIMDSPNVYRFDYAQLRRFGIGREQLPPGSVIVNQPDAFYHLDKKSFWLIVSALTALGGFTTLTLIGAARRQRVERALSASREELRRAEEKYRSIFENSALGIFRADVAGRALDANPALAAMLGYPTASALTASGGDLFALLNLDAEARVRLARTDLPESQVLETRAVRPSGERLYVKLSVRPELDEQGRLICLEGFMEDVTMRKAAEAALEESRERLQTVLDALPQLIYLKSVKNRETGEAEYAWGNKAFISFFQLEAGFQLDAGGSSGKTDDDLYADPAEAEAARAADAAVIAENRPSHGVKWRVKSPKGARGREVWLETTRIPLRDERGQVVGLLTASEDISEKINLERQLLQSQKMEAIGALAGGIAHDFNNLLTTIVNSIELALPDVREMGGQTQQLASMDLERALTAARRGGRLVKQILAFGRADSDEARPIDLVQVIEESISMLKASLPRNIRLAIHLPGGPAPAVGDPTRLQQVIMNLCANAFQAMGERGGALSVGLEPATVGEDSGIVGLSPGEYYRLWVSDTGPGLAPEHMDRIFDPFFTTKEKGVGTGLGLSVALGIAKAHGGTILPRNRSAEEGGGASFEVYAPRAAALSASEAVGAETGLKVSGSILFVEDDEDQFYAAPRVLEGLGWRVVAQRDPLEALELFKSCPGYFDLVVTDFDMPGMNGVELARAIAEIDPAKPVVLVTGYRAEADKTGLPPSIRAVVSKPYEKLELARTLAAAQGSQAGKHTESLPGGPWCPASWSSMTT